MKNPLKFPRTECVRYNTSQINSCLQNPRYGFTINEEERRESHGEEVRFLIVALVMAAVGDRVGFGDGKDVGENLCGWFLPLKNSIYVPSTFPI